MRLATGARLRAAGAGEDLRSSTRGAPAETTLRGTGVRAPPGASGRSLTPARRNLQHNRNPPALVLTKRPRSRELKPVRRTPAAIGSAGRPDNRLNDGTRRPAQWGGMVRNGMSGAVVRSGTAVGAGTPTGKKSWTGSVHPCPPTNAPGSRTVIPGRTSSIRSRFLRIWA